LQKTLLNKRQLLLVGFTIIIMVVFIAPIVNVSSARIIKQEVDSVTVDNTTSFHKKISGQKFWLAIKTTFSEHTILTIEYKSRVSLNNSKTNFFSYLFHGKETPFHTYGLGRWNQGSDIDKYFQIHIGRLNWSYYHSDPECIGWANPHHKWVIDSWILGESCYFTFIFHAAETLLDVWINTTKNTTFITTQGTEVFKVEREDFFGNLNIGWKRGTIILNGEKEIHINNSLFAWFETAGLNTGFELLKYRLPTGEYESKFQIDKRGTTKIIKESENFLKNLQWGSSGKWTFMVTMANIGIVKTYPNIHLYGADIKLP